MRNKNIAVEYLAAVFFCSFANKDAISASKSVKIHLKMPDLFFLLPIVSGMFRKYAQKSHSKRFVYK